ncbi:AAA family ATPase [Leisingera caerulea]|uniref:AAA family ATPase n=1 Tax=Leisingera caerulea TaxID=506591 RepID=UPI0021A3136F|nr:recombinase RecF [Leisingera caerulea]UWQ85011.1 recombinase RecF [Leisingera caerulea]
MKLLSVNMNNVRRFTQPMEVLNIGPGLNVLAAPNEQGKSTLFDALHALFFFEAKSWKQKEAASLAPRAGGNPEISAGIDVDGQSYRISKVFSSRANQRLVTVHRDGHLFKQSEDAEEWIRTLVKPPKDGGPAGLLWVRQGVTSLISGKDDDTLAARRDLLSSVAGEIEDITGGRQMEKIRAALKNDLETYLTKSGAIKKHGPLWEAEQAVANLDGQMADLRCKVEQLHTKLVERRELQDEKTVLVDPVAIQERADALDAARAALKAAEAYQENQAKADEAHQTAQLVLETHQDRIKTAEEQLSEFREAKKALDELQKTVSGAEDQLGEAAKGLEKAKTAEQEARKNQLSADEIRDAAHAAEANRKGAERRQELAKRLEDAQRHSSEAAAARRTIDCSPDARQMEQLEEAWQELELLKRAREASAAAITLTADAGQQDRVTLNGNPLQPGHRVALPDGGDIAVAGVGSIRVHPAEQRGETVLVKARAEFGVALEATGCSTLQAARQSEKERKSAEVTLRDANAKLKISAPDGMQALMDEIAILPETVAQDASLPSATDADAAFRAARDRHAKILADLEGVRADHDAKHGDARELRVRRDEAQNRVDRATSAVGHPDERDRELTALRAKTPELERTYEEAKQQAQELAANAPDLSLAQAGAQRAQNVVDQADRRLSEIGIRLSALEALITHEADLSVEEKLREVEGKREAALSHAEQVQAEVKVLQRLDQALSVAQKQAHDAYIGPIRNELRPLLSMVLPGAELTLDADSVLPTGLTRPEGEDSYDQLSGGTQEQIALLVRLAFARLLTKSGTPAPIILDDAIVYTDDDRIERMFNALTQQAGDMQIIVLSCRQKVFRGLGGQTLSIRQAANEANA